MIEWTRGAVGQTGTPNLVLTSENRPMQIDRSRFLLLAASIAASGCTIIDQRGQTDAATSAPIDSGTSADTGVTPDSTLVVVDTGVDDAETSTLDVTEAGCDDDDAAALPSSADCHAVICSAPEISMQCEGFITYYKPHVAERAVACHRAIHMCDADLVAKCGLDALDAACPDPTASSWCASFLAGCAADGGISDAAADGSTDGGTGLQLDDCKRYVNGLNANGRDAMAMCVFHEGMCKRPFAECAGKLGTL